MAHMAERVSQPLALLEQHAGHQLHVPDMQALYKTLAPAQTEMAAPVETWYIPQNRIQGKLFHFATSAHQDLAVALYIQNSQISILFSL
jgi:hypothetical protein